MPFKPSEIAPQTRVANDAARYAETVLSILAAEWQTIAVLQVARCVGVTRIRRILTRSSADTLIGLVLQKLINEDLIKITGEIAYFQPKLIAWFEERAKIGAQAPIPLGSATESES